jgi:hypothetical protein
MAIQDFGSACLRHLTVFCDESCGPKVHIGFNEILWFDQIACGEVRLALSTRKEAKENSQS